MAKAGVLLLSALVLVQSSGNPILPGWYADPEAHVFAGQYWIYPTYSAPYASASRGHGAPMAPSRTIWADRSSTSSTTAHSRSISSSSKIATARTTSSMEAGGTATSPG